MTVYELARKLRNKEISSVEVTKAYLDKIETDDPAVHAYLTVTRDIALESAKKADQRFAGGKDNLPLLMGIPMNLKDNICTDGVRTTCASKMLETFIPPYSATLWNRLMEQGAVLLGKVNMDEFAMGGSTETSYFGVTANPFDTTRVSGGSSGGSAASVASRMCAYSIGTDTGGSIRQPASFCGVVGLKPTYGRVSRYGIVAFASSLDQAGVLAQNVSDAAAVLEAIAGVDPLDATTVNQPLSLEKQMKQGMSGLKIGIPKEYLEEGIDAQVRNSVLEAVHKLESLGASAEEFSMETAPYALPAYYIISCAEASSNLAMFDGIRFGYRAKDYTDLDSLYKLSRSQGFGMEVKRRILLGTYALSSGYYEAYYIKALKTRTLIAKAFKTAFEKYDILITPVAPTTAYKIGEKKDPLENYMADLCTCSPNLAGLPAMSIPCGFDKSGMPIGMQILARSFEEAMLCRVGFAYEQLEQKNGGQSSGI